MKIDVAIQSYKKPESLIYTLLSLKKVSGQHIDTIYIQDDKSNDGSIECFKSAYFTEAMSPIKIVVKENSEKSLISKTMYTSGMKAKSLKFWKHAYSSDDIRYQYAINNTDKKYLLLIHDDILFNDDIVEKYLDSITSKNNCCIVGDLGQCWICPNNEKYACTPSKILAGVKPKLWPRNFRKMKKVPLYRLRRDCRINEWCCLIDVDVARSIAQKYNVYFGNYQSGGDVGAYWFDTIVKLNYEFDDPVAECRDEYYLHCWQGHSGHSVWVDQGQGKSIYDRQMIIDKLIKDFNFDFNKIRT